MPDLDRWSNLERHLVVAQLSIRILIAALVVWGLEEATIRASAMRSGAGVPERGA